MKPFAMAAYVTAVLMTPLPAGAETPPLCGMGTLRNVEAVVDIVPTQAHTEVRERRNKRGEREMVVTTSPSERRTRNYLVAVQIDNLVYTGRASGDAPWNFDPTRLVINDPIGVCLADNKLILKRPDGKDYKTKVVRAVRVANDTGDSTKWLWRAAQTLADALEDHP